MRCVAADAEALSTLTRGGRHDAAVRAALTAAILERVEVVVPAAVLPSATEGFGTIQRSTPASLPEGGVAIVDTDRWLILSADVADMEALTPPGSDIAVRGLADR